MTYVMTLVWLALVFLAAWWVEKVWRKMLGQLFQAFIIPGLLVREVSRALGCIPAVAKIKRVKFFTSKGLVEFEHEEPKLPVFGYVLIDFAPVVGTCVLLILMALFVKFNVSEMLDGKVAAPASGFFGAAWWMVTVPFTRAYRVITGSAQGGLFNIWTWVVFYMSVVACIAMRPTKAELKESRWGLLVLGLALLLLDLIFAMIHLPDFVLDIVQLPVSFLVTFMTMACLITLLAELITWLTSPKKATKASEAPKEELAFDVGHGEIDAAEPPAQATPHHHVPLSPTEDAPTPAPSPTSNPSPAPEAKPAEDAGGAVESGPEPEPDRKAEPSDPA